jgi:hypothetical protein
MKKETITESHVSDGENFFPKVEHEFHEPSEHPTRRIMDKRVKKDDNPYAI